MTLKEFLKHRDFVLQMDDLENATHKDEHEKQNRQ